MAITLNNLVVVPTNSLSYTPNAVANAVLVVVVATEDVSDDQGEVSVSFGGVNLTAASRAASRTSHSNEVGIFYLVNPGTSTGTILVSGGQADRLGSVAMTLGGVDQATPIDTAHGIERLGGDSYPYTVSTVGTTNNDRSYVLSCLSGAIGAQNIGLIGGSILVNQAVASTLDLGVGYSIQDPSGFYTHTWREYSSFSTQRFAACSAAFMEAAGAPPELSLELDGVTADEAVGQPQLSVGAVSLLPSSILPDDAIGEPSLLVADHLLTLSAIDSISSVGSQAVTPAPVTLEPVGISNAGVVGAPVLTQGGAPSQSVNVEAIDTNAQVGLPAVTPVAVSVEPAGVTSTSAVGESSLNAALILTPSGIESTEAVSSPVLDAGAVDLAPSSINELTAVGVPSVISENQILQLIGIDNSSAVGVPRIGEIVTERPIVCLDLVIAREALALSVLKSTLDIQIHRACR